MRIIAGRFRGRALLPPKGVRIRPTSDRGREALFDLLEHGEPPLRGARFADLFCGTGAVGIEACSRGAARGKFDLAFLDPPYRPGRAPAALGGLWHGWLAPGARIVVELGAKEPFEQPEGF